MPHEFERGAPNSPHTLEPAKDSTYVLLSRLNPVEDAAYDSVPSQGWRHECSPNTCVSSLDDLRSWTRSDDTPCIYWIQSDGTPCIYWIYGPSGAGKTTLAYTCCKELDDGNQLGASFFCAKAFPRCRDVRKIVPTIAYQLARYSHAFQSCLLQVLQDSPDYTTYDLYTQFEKLVQAPLLEAKYSFPTSSQPVILIDGLDECEDIDDVQTLLGTFIRCIPRLPIKILVTSSPELVTTLQKHAMPSRVVHLYHLDQFRSSAQTDITNQLTQGLHGLRSTKGQIDSIATRAMGSFIYATTCARYMWSAELRARALNSEQIPSILDLISGPVGNGLSALDRLYMAILMSISEELGLESSEAQTGIFVLQTVICARAPMSVDTLGGLLRMDQSELFQLLGPLFPFLHVSGDGKTVLIFHQSFCTFMLHPHHSGNFYCDVKQHNHQLALRCLEIMKSTLQFNICGREISCALDSDILGLLDQADQSISCELLHACRYWGYYVENAAPSETLHSYINDFLINDLLHWMEVLNLKRLIHEGVSVLSRVQKWLQSCYSYTEIHEFTQDALSFCTSFANSSASQCTPQIYIFALPTWPKTSPVSQCYWEIISTALRSTGLPVDGGESALLSTWSTGSAVLSVASSLEGTQLLSSTASFSQSLALWDSDSGNPLDLEAITAKKDLDVINSVSFSRDGSYIALGSRNYLTSAWGITGTQTLEKTFQFEDHFGPVNSVALSPDGTLVASGSDDCSVRVRPLSQPTTALPDNISGTWHRQHTRSVRSVAFSPDSTLVVSGSNDCNMCVMDARSGHLEACPITGHTDSVNSVAFSPNGRFIVSGSSDCTIRLWDVSNKFILHGDPIEGHTKSVNSVVFSPNGTHLVSGSSDLTIRVWEVQDGMMTAGPFLGHTKPINVVVFTPDGTRIVSGSDDQTIRVWDAEQAGLHMQFPLSEDFSRASPTIQPNEMTATEMLECLVKHGCLDLTSTIDQQATSSGLVVGGGFGDIYTGKLHDGTDIAIKVLRFAKLTEDRGKSLKRAMREIYGWSKLKHENIHELLGVTVHQGRLGMVSRWMEHGNLREYIQKNPTEDRYQMCIQVSAGLRYLHGRRMVHGDLKACNILVSQDGVAKLTDFDHLIMSNCSLKFSETSRVGGGTLRWMAPELLIATRSHQRNMRTDIYALGMTLLEIITGSVPYESQCRMEVQVLIKLTAKVLPERVSHFNQNERGDRTWALLVQCWNHDPDARPTAGDVHDTLRRLTNGATLSSVS